jgi:hypothetical protein
MRRIGRVLFVLFYFAATISVNSERSAFAAYRVAHPTPSEFEAAKAPHQSFVKFLPYFSHAKKGTSAPADVPPALFSIPRLTIRKFEDRPQIEYSSSCDCRPHSSRAPPALI